MRGNIPELAQALRSRFSEHHALLIRISLDLVEHLDEAIATLDGEVEALMAPFAEAAARIDTVTGVGQRAAQCAVAEIGVDMSAFPTASHLASWAGCCPGNNITGGKRRSGRTTKGDPWLNDVLNQCAWAAAHSRDTYLSAQFWRLARRMGKKKAAVAVAHSIPSSSGTCSPTSATTRTWAGTTSSSVTPYGSVTEPSTSSSAWATRSPSRRLTWPEPLTPQIFWSAWPHRPSQGCTDQHVGRPIPRTEQHQRAQPGRIDTDITRPF